jgi:hypothetical protein
MIRIISFYFALALLISSCASTINTTGVHNYDSKITSIYIECTTPERINKFSKNLCDMLKDKFESQGIRTTINLIDESIPSLSTDSNSYDSELLIKITHVRISLYNGMPCGTLMNIEAFKQGDKKPIWAAKIQTKGTNLTGPGNPDRVTNEIIEQMKKDKFMI